MIEFYGGYQVYSESGVDLTLLRENLKRPLAMRFDGNARMLAFLEELARAKQKPSSQPSDLGRGVPMLDMPAILGQLVQQRVEFVLVGGLAMIAHGSAYITKDVDICYSRTESNIKALTTALEALHPYLRGAPPGLPFRLDAATVQAGLNFTLTTDRGDLDLLGEISGIGSYEQVIAQSAEHEIYGLKVRVLSLDGLLAAKKSAGRIKDRLHILELDELKKLRDANQ
jgi:hypothetical protein